MQQLLTAPYPTASDVSSFLHLVQYHVASAMQQPLAVPYAIPFLGDLTVMHHLFPLRKWVDS